MSISGTGSFSFCDHFKYSIKSSFQVPCEVVKEQGCPEAIKKVSIAVSTVFLVGFFWHIGAASYDKFKFRREVRLFMHDNNAYARTHRIDLELNPGLIGGRVGCYGIKRYIDKLVLSTVVKLTPSAQVLTVVLIREGKGCIRIANQHHGVAFGNFICTELYATVLFRDSTQAADYIATKPVIWECELYNSMSKEPSPALIRAKPNDLFITFPGSPRHPEGQIIRKVGEGIRRNPSVETLTIAQLKEEYRVSPTVIMKAFIDLWDQKSRLGRIV